MRALLERSRPARAIVVVLAASVVLGLARAATAENDFGFRHALLWPEQQPVVQAIDTPTSVAPHPRRARRIWAASRMRPLRITLARRRHHVLVAEAHRGRRAQFRAAGVRPVVRSQVSSTKLIVLPVPPRPALVTLYEDRTLRDGDAVMLADGIHVFRGTRQWPHRPDDFVRLTFAAALDWHFRQTLDVLDRNPPTRWSSMGSTAG